MQDNEYLWNLWHGCKRKSEGCARCYVYRSDEKHGIDPEEVKKTASFSLPVQRKRNGDYKVPSGSLIWTCFTSDFLLDTADIWRKEAWEMMRERADCTFLFITKRPERFLECIPDDWGDGYPNVVMYCTAENQKRADERLPIFLKLPVRKKGLIIEPMLSKVDLRDYLQKGEISTVTVGGESGDGARTLKYEWVLDVREQCCKANVGFAFKQTGLHFEKDGKLYRIPRKLQHEQAKKAGLDTAPRVWEQGNSQ